MCSKCAEVESQAEDITVLDPRDLTRTETLFCIQPPTVDVTQKEWLNPVVYIVMYVGHPNQCTIIVRY
jgi:hypothetical protein